LIFIAAIMIVIYIFCLLIDLILSGQLAGLFAIKSFNDSCVDENPNLIHTTKEIISSATTFRKEVMNIVHWLFS
jgi:hypothetical protein